MGQTIPSISNSPSEEEESEDAISADVDGDDDDSSRAADENHSSMHHLQVTSNSKLNRNNSKKSAQSADGTVGTRSSTRSPSRVASTVCRNNSNRVVVSSSSPGKTNVTISLKSNGNGKLSKSITENFLCRSITSQPQNNPTEYASPASKNHYMETSINQTQTLQHAPKPRIGKFYFFL
jgi:hypothetical protein